MCGLRATWVCAGREPERACPKGRRKSAGDLSDRTPGAAAGWNKPAQLRKEKTPEGVRNAERGTNRGWEPRERGLPELRTLEGTEPYGRLLQALVVWSAASGHTLERRPKLKRVERSCVTQRAGRLPREPHEPGKVEGVGSKPK